MSRSMLEMLMLMAQEEPQRLRSESEKVRQRIFAQTAALKTRIEASERLSMLWREYCEERKRTEERLALARTDYREMLRKSESAALVGRPRLYWCAKSIFAKLRRRSLEYQVIDARVKLSAVQASRDKLALLLKRMGIDDGKDLSHLFDFDGAEKLSVEHSRAMADSFQKIQALHNEQALLQGKILDLDIGLSNAAALVTDATNPGGSISYDRPPAVVDSGKMFASRSPHVGFVNRPKLLALVDQCEYSAEHAERDLQKVREGLKLATEAAVAGRPTRLSRDWLEYCRAIVCRYKEHSGETLTPP